MTTTHFVNLDTNTIVNFSTFKQHPVFDNFPYAWVNDPRLTHIDTWIVQFNAPFARFYETNQPAVPLWKEIERTDVPTYNATAQRWERDWVVRDKTETELIWLNEQLQRQAAEARGFAYQQEADPLYFKAQRGETPMQEWLDKVQEIRALYPNPPQVVIPEDEE